MSLSTVTSSALSPTSSVVSAVAPNISLGGPDVRSINADEWEKERSTLYQQLDEKVITNILIDFHRLAKALQPLGIEVYDESNKSLPVSVV
jgi:hypothetical protein